MLQSTGSDTTERLNNVISGAQGEHLGPRLGLAQRLGLAGGWEGSASWLSLRGLP